MSTPDIHSCSVFCERTQCLKDRIQALEAQVAALQRDASVHQLIQRACGELPDGWQIRLEMENGSGYFYLNNPEGDDVQFDDDHEHLSSSLLSAIETAIAAQEGAATAPAQQGE